MKKPYLLFVCLTLLLSLATDVWGRYTLPEQETYQQKTVAKKTGELRSLLTGKFEKLDGSRYYSKESGKGHYGRFEDVLWTLESETELRDNLLCPLYTLFTVKDKSGKEIMTCKNDYDYEAQQILTTQRDAGKTKTKQSALPLKTPITDYATMIYYLRPFMKELMAGETIYFNFLSGEPGLYRLKARITGEERLKVGPQSIETVQVEVTPDMGALNIIVDKLVPPTLLWYGKNGSYPWLKYEGLESGRRSPHIITTVEELFPFEPPLKNE